MRVSARLFDSSRPGVDVLETHISTVAFDGDVVHKRKKDVSFPFVDLSSPELREAICWRELELNRRFSPDVYLGVEEVVDDDGVVVDHAIVVLRPGCTATEREIIDHARESIAGYKVPKSIDFRTDPLPVSGALKPLKRELRAPYWEHQKR